MDIATHALSGLLVGHAAGEATAGRRAFWVAAATAPDLDGLAGLAGRVAYYDYHRALLHGLPGSVLLVAAAALLFRRLGFGRTREGLAIAGVAVASHLLLDATTSFGFEWLFPFSRTSFHGDLLFMVDAAFLALLAGSVGLCWPRSSNRKAWGRIGLVALASYLGAAAICRGTVAASVRQAQARGQLPPGDVSILPQPPWLLSWAAFIEAEDSTWAGPMAVRSPDTSRVAPYRAPTADARLATALATPAARRFLGFARFPHVTRVDSAGGASFELQDLRFSLSGWERSNWWYGVRIETDHVGVVRYAGFTNP